MIRSDSKQEVIHHHQQTTNNNNKHAHSHSFTHSITKDSDLLFVTCVGPYARPSIVLSIINSEQTSKRRTIESTIQQDQPANIIRDDHPRSSNEATIRTPEQLSSSEPHQSQEQSEWYASSNCSPLSQPFPMHRHYLN